MIFFEFSHKPVTRGNAYKLHKIRCSSRIGSNFLPIVLLMCGTLLILLLRVDLSDRLLLHFSSTFRAGQLCFLLSLAVLLKLLTLTVFHGMFGFT